MLSTYFYWNSFLWKSAMESALERPLGVVCSWPYTENTVGTRISHGLMHNRNGADDKSTWQCPRCVIERCAVERELIHLSYCILGQKKEAALQVASPPSKLKLITHDCNSARALHPPSRRLTSSDFSIWREESRSKGTVHAGNCLTFFDRCSCIYLCCNYYYKRISNNSLL